MNSLSTIDQLVEALRCLPGVGPKTAQRMVMHLLERDRDGARNLAANLNSAMEKIRHCQKCRNFTEHDVCHICTSTTRDVSTLCIVENPGDVIAIEQTGHYQGRYFVLMGTLSPIDGIGPKEIGMDELMARCNEEVEEVILALSSSVEGEATSHYISELVKLKNIRVSRIAQGIPLGSELEYVDGGTLTHALNGRKII
ncbi:MAG TPA: recombination protein RecR [Gammaproteobacteria bacterium]|nr:recombination protein RecR [Gammaproteobacteria bacterium]HIL96853.1 recombination protein RecR [Pseudomonadales bacterium]